MGVTDTRIKLTEEKKKRVGVGKGGKEGRDEKEGGLRTQSETSLGRVGEEEGCL